MRLLLFLYFILFTDCDFCYGQELKPGFDYREYLGTLRRSAMQVDSGFRGNVPAEKDFSRVYRSPIMGLDNKYDIWLSRDKTIMALNLRGTMSEMDSWLENFYCAMIPAQGSLHLTDSFTFNYKFASDPRAAVHTGWAIGIASLAPDIMDKILFFYSKGTKQLIVEGHSQGGALAFLLSSYLHYEIEAGRLPNDLVIKTYCSAGPKPGNLYYAYDFEYINKGGWAFNVVNAPDWVPETPATIQTIQDFNNINPFRDVKGQLKKERLVLRLYAGHIYKKLVRPGYKERGRFEHYLGNKAFKQVRKFMPQMEEPEYVKSFNYMRAGIPVVLEPDSAYYNRFPDTGSNIFRHHLFTPYYYQVNRIYGR